ncbi:MAG: hypothetical protein HY892_10145 [Deltaproteobacteria bacterium]|nr:hypothetical protein [Deltaproteobacteria bacterium]
MKKIGVTVPSITPGQQRLFEALAEVFPVRFEQRYFQEEADLDAWLAPAADRDLVDRLPQTARPCYAVLRPDQLLPEGGGPVIVFADSAFLPAALRARRIESEEAGATKVLPSWLENGTTLASKSGAPLWILREPRKGGHHHVSLPLPELQAGEPLFQYFHGRRFLALLPLFLFLRALTEDPTWLRPPLQACFMFDDPNLHWPTYGFIDYAEIARQAEKHRYHVSFATVPRDGWFLHEPTAAIFKRHADRLSLLIHGNDHTRDELAQPYPDRERRALIGEALQRVGQLEKRSGIEISRVMAPPHGACSAAVLGEMARAGFEAACVSRGSLAFHNPGAPWLRSLGMGPSDHLNGLTVIPRFPFSARCHNSILLAAVLGQPIIPMGHHTGVAAGLDLLEELADFIHSLGQVQWTDLRQICRSLYSRKYAGGQLHLKLHAGRVRVPVDEGTDRIYAERSWTEDRENPDLAWRAAGAGPEWRWQRADETIRVTPGQTVELVTDPALLQTGTLEARRKRRLWPFLRRSLAEARDRSAPLRRRALGRASD